MLRYSGGNKHSTGKPADDYLCAFVLVDICFHTATQNVPTVDDKKT